MWTTEGTGKSAHALHSRTGARNMREHRQALRQQAEARNATTPHDRTRAHQKGLCCTGDEANPFDQMQLAAS